MGMISWGEGESLGKGWWCWLAVNLLHFNIHRFAPLMLVIFGKTPLLKDGMATKPTPTQAEKRKKTRENTVNCFEKSLLWEAMMTFKSPGLSRPQTYWETRDETKCLSLALLIYTRTFQDLNQRINERLWTASWSNTNPKKNLYKFNFS